MKKRKNKGYRCGNSRVVIITLLLFFLCNTSSMYSQTDRLKELYNNIVESEGKDTNSIREMVLKIRHPRIDSLAITFPYANNLYDFYKKQGLNFQKENIIDALAGNYYLKGDYYEAIEKYLEWVPLIADTNYQDKFAVNYNIANTFKNLEKYDDAIKYLKKSISYLPRIEDQNYDFRAYNLMGIIYFSNNDFVKSESNLIKAYNISREMNNLKNKAMVSNNLGMIYQNKSDFDKALEYYKIAGDINKKSNFLRSYQKNLLNVANVYVKMNKLDSAKKYFDFIRITFKDYNNLEIEKSYNFNISSYYKAVGNYQMALEYYQKYSYLNDSLQIREKNSEIEMIFNEFELKNKIRENEMLSSDNKSKDIKLAENKLMLVMALAIITLAVIVFYFLIRKGKRDKELNNLLKEKNEDVQSANSELNRVNKILGEESRKLALVNKRLMDSEKLLRKNNIEKDRFFSIISHDIRDPLQSLMLGTELLNMQINREMYAKAAKNSVSITNAAHSLKAMMENLFTWAEAKSGSLKVIPVDTKPVQIIQNIRSLFASEIEEKGVNFNIKIPGDMTIRADMNLLHTIFKNLIYNAVKYTDPNGNITIDSIKIDDFFLFTVEDDGVGISEENLEKLFRLDTVYSTKGTKNESGTGLGLIICQEFVERHGGKIWVESKQGSWTKFSFTIRDDM